MREVIPAILGNIIVYGLLGLFCLYVGRTWARWFRSELKLTLPRWRSEIATIGFVASTVSLAVIVFLAAHALLTGGFPYYSRPLMTAFGLGLLTASCGVMAALIGKGQLEKPTIISSLLCLLIWFVAAAAQ